MKLFPQYLKSRAKIIVIYLVIITMMLYVLYKVLGIVLPEEGGIFAPLPWMPLPLSAVDLALIAAGALLFLFCDATLERMSALLTGKVKKLMRHT